MLELERLCELYRTAHDENAAHGQQQKARELLAAIDADQLITEFLSLPEMAHDSDYQSGTFPHKKGDPKFRTFDDFANHVVFFHAWDEGGSNRERKEKLRQDRIGILVRFILLERARAVRKTDFDYTALFGDRFYLALWPPHGAALGLPDPTPNEVTV